MYPANLENPEILLSSADQSKTTPDTLYVAANRD